jgi:predicted amidophosphoribosyltransferase
MAFPIKVCAVCGEQFELKPNKPGFANRCPECTEQDDADPKTGKAKESGPDRELNAERRKAMRELLYRKDS